jgi:hypothetical protein
LILRDISNFLSSFVTNPNRGPSISESTSDSGQSDSLADFYDESAAAFFKAAIAISLAKNVLVTHRTNLRMSVP